MNVNLKNLKMREKYLNWLAGAKGFSPATIDAVERAIARWDRFAGHDDYTKFNQKAATRFKEHLLEEGRRKGHDSSTAAYHTMRHLKTFFTWLVTQPGYKSRINPDSISYLSLDRKKVREIVTPKPQSFPSLAHVKALVDSIEVHDEIDLRDKAQISFLLLSGMRVEAITTLPLGAVDKTTLEIRQLPQLGVRTKFGKPMITRLCEFDGDLLAQVLKWIDYLEKVKMFSPTDPLFPRSLVVQHPDTLSYVSTEVEKRSWSGTGAIRQIIADRSAKAGLPYFKPHAFRQAASHLSLDACRSPEEIRAVSQNLGHENIGTTIMNYGKLDQFRVAEIIKNMDFSAKRDDGISEVEMKALENLMRKVHKSS